jgi:hypothetical protein
MSHEWMLDLLTDLKGFAQKNAMTALAEHLDDALLIAAREMRGSASQCSGVSSADHDQHTRLSGTSSAHDIA